MDPRPPRASRSREPILATNKRSTIQILDLVSSKGLLIGLKRVYVYELQKSIMKCLYLQALIRDIRQRPSLDAPLSYVYPRTPHLPMFE